MTTKQHAADTLNSIASDIQRVTRPRVVREDLRAALARVAELREAGMHFEADFVESQIEHLRRAA